MAKKSQPKITTFLKNVTKTLSNKLKSSSQDTTRISLRLLPKKLNYSEHELNNTFKEIFIPSSTHKKSTKSKIDITSLTGEYFKSIHDQFAINKTTYDKVIKLEPKIEQAENIIIPSILSPNSLKHYEFKTTFNTCVNDILSEETQNDILDHLNDFFNNQLKLGDKLHSWIRDALFIYGVKPVLILPNNIINQIRNNSISFESFSNYINEIESNNLTLSTETLKSDINTIDIDVISTSVSEIISDESINDVLTSLNIDINSNNDINDKTNSELGKFLSLSIENVYKDISNASLDFIDLTDRVEHLALPKQKQSVNNDRILNNYMSFYGTSDSNKKSSKSGDNIESIKFKTDIIINMGDYINPSNVSNSHPILLELPPESIVPIYVNQDPSQHICYLVLLDEDNQPINIDKERYSNEFNDYDLYQNFSTKLIEKAHGSCSNYSYTSYSKLKKLFSNKLVVSKTLRKTHELFLDNLVTSSMKNLGFTNVDFNLKSAMSSTLFFRLLRHKKTRFLFIPSFMMMYMAFKYKDNGTGISKMEEISFPLSLKISYLLTNIFKLITQAVDTTEIKLSLDENIGNPIEFLHKLKSLLVANKAVDITYDPIRIIKSLTDRQFSFVLDNIPGVKSFNLEKSTTSKGSNTNMADDKLIEIVDNILTTLLEVPPSAYNELSENEYSRSLTTINMLFDLKISRKRKMVIKHLNHLIRNYLLFDTVLQNEVKTILEKKLKEKKLSQKGINELSLYLFNNLKIFIPEPRIVFDKTEFEQASEYIKFIDDIVDKIFNNDMINNRDLQDIMKNIATHVKVKLYKQMLNKTDLVLGLDNVLQDFENVNILELMEVEEIMTNYKKLLDDYKNKVTPESEEGGGSSSSGW